MGSNVGPAVTTQFIGLIIANKGWRMEAGNALLSELDGLRTRQRTGLETANPSG
jgi:hypothetical protein